VIRGLAVVAFATLVTGVLAGTAGAQEFPALYAVTGDLAIRRAPGAGAEVLAQLTPGQTGVEVVALSDDGLWGLMRAGELGESGWAPMAGLALQGTMGWMEGALPLHCLGTEPFWTLDLSLPGTEARFDDFDTPITLHTSAPDLPTTRFPPSLAVPLSGARQGLAVIRPAECSDGMSEIAFGLELLLYWTGPEWGALSGCCTLQARD
jgi:Predicted membrane protein